MKTVTPAPLVSLIITGHFQESPGYATWRPRGTDDYLLMLTLSGSGRVGHATGEVRTAAGDGFLLRPGTPHDYGTARGASGWELLWAHFLPRPHWHDWLQWPETAPGIGLLSLDDEIREPIENALGRMHRLAGSGVARRSEFAMNALEEALLWCDAINPASLSSQRDPRVARAMNFLREHLREPVSAADAARAAGLSVSRLAHLFREQVGETPREFVERERIARAQQLLSLTGRSIAAVAEEVGFESPFYFTLRFKKRTGLSPREWRQAALTPSV